MPQTSSTLSSPASVSWGHMVAGLGSQALAATSSPGTISQLSVSGIGSKTGTHTRTHTPLHSKADTGRFNIAKKSDFSIAFIAEALGRADGGHVGGGTGTGAGGREAVAGKGLSAARNMWRNSAEELSLKIGIEKVNVRKAAAIQLQAGVRRRAVQGPFNQHLVEYRRTSYIQVLLARPRTRIHTPHTHTLSLSLSLSLSLTHTHTHTKCIWHAPERASERER